MATNLYIYICANHINAAHALNCGITDFKMSSKRKQQMNEGNATEKRNVERL